MSVKHALLAVLTVEPAGAYRLREQFERRTGGTWPLNMGQVATTLDRLVRDGLVELADGEGEVQRYSLSAAGRVALEGWWSHPVDRSVAAREELAMKLAMAVTVPGVDIARMVQAQRSETVRSMQAMTRLKSDVPDDDLAWGLLLDHMIFAAEAEVRWLDHVESRVARASAAQGAAEVGKAGRVSSVAANGSAK